MLKNLFCSSFLRRNWWISKFYSQWSLKNTRIYNLISGPHFTRFSAVVAKNGKISSLSLFWNKHADSRWQQQSYFRSTSSDFSIIYFQIGIVFQLKYYQYPNQALLSNKRKEFSTDTYGFYRHALQIHYQLSWLVTERACTKNSRKLMSRMWLLAAS